MGTVGAEEEEEPESMMLRERRREGGVILWRVAEKKNVQVPQKHTKRNEKYEKKAKKVSFFLRKTIISF